MYLAWLLATPLIPSCLPPQHTLTSEMSAKPLPLALIWGSGRREGQEEGGKSGATWSSLHLLWNCWIWRPRLLTLASFPGPIQHELPVHVEWVFFFLFSFGEKVVENLSVLKNAFEQLLSMKSFCTHVHTCFEFQCSKLLGYRKLFSPFFGCTYRTIKEHVNGQNRL